MGSVGAAVPGYYRSVMVEAGGAETEILLGRPVCGSGVCFSVTGGGRVEGKLREKMNDGEGKERLVRLV